MKTSTYILSTSQKWIFAIVLMLGFLFAGCEESPSSSGSQNAPTPPSTTELEGRWIGLDQNGNKDGYTMLHLFGSGGVYRSYPSEGSVKEVYMEFDYKKFNNFQLQVRMISHQINGESQQVSDDEETVYYTLNEQTLQIFGQTFARE